MPRRRNQYPGVYPYVTVTGQKRWGAIVSLGYDWETGRPKQRRKQGFPSRAEAIAWSVKQREGRRVSLTVEPSMKPLGTWLAEWLDLRTPELRQSSIMMYRRAFRWFAPLHEIPLSQVTPAHVERECARLIREGHIAPSVASAKSKISTALNAAIRAGMLLTNPAAIANGPPGKRQPRPSFSLEQATTFLEATASDGQWGLLWRFMIQTWTRLGEVLELRWKDVDLDRGTIQIQRAQTTVRGTNQVTGKPMITFAAGPLKTSESRRTIPLADDLLAALKCHRKEQVKESQQWTANGLVFPNQSGGWLDRKRLGEELSAACGRAGVPKVTAHGLRHTGGSLAAHAGFDPKTISELMGHADVMTTLRTYVHSNEVQHRRLADAIGELFRSKTEADSDAV